MTKQYTTVAEITKYCRDKGMSEIDIACTISAAIGQGCIELKLPCHECKGPMWCNTCWARKVHDGG